MGFEVSFVTAQDAQPHLDFYLGESTLNATHGIVGQFMNAKASVEKTENGAIVHVNGHTVKTAQRPVPGRPEQTCYKYFDSQASGLIDGDFSDYETEGMFSAAKTFNKFFTASDVPADAEKYVQHMAQQERVHQKRIHQKMIKALGGCEAGCETVENT